MTDEPHPIQVARKRAQSPTPTSEVGMCLRETRECFDVPSGAKDAITAWRYARTKHLVAAADIDDIPWPVPIFWAGGSEGHGHVAISARRRGYCWSMDIRRPGYWDRVPITEIADKWEGLTLLGWTEDLNGVRVYRPDPPKRDKGHVQRLVSKLLPDPPPVDQAGKVRVRARRRRGVNK